MAAQVAASQEGLSSMELVSHEFFKEVLGSFISFSKTDTEARCVSPKQKALGKSRGLYKKAVLVSKYRVILA
jgi:hypothetical protein